MLTIPEDLLASADYPSMELPQAIITTYHGVERVLSTQVLVTRPTLVLVCSGVKQMASPTSESVLTVSSGNLVAFLSAMSRASFKRYFKVIYGMAPGKWLQESRLKHARSLALNRKRSVSEICELSG